jgi:riboflavin kinase
MVITGKIVTGIGVGSLFVGMDWVREQIHKKLGFDPYPGTLNVRMDMETSRRYRSLLEEVEGIPLEPPDDRYRRGKCFRGIINGNVDGAIVVPLVPDYPEDIVEIIAPVNLRERLGLEDGSDVTVDILES